jgi:hypothetical protein
VAARSGLSAVIAVPLVAPAWFIGEQAQEVGWHADHLTLAVEVDVEGDIVGMDLVAVMK